MHCLKMTFCYFIESFSQTSGYAKNLSVVNNINRIKSQLRNINHLHYTFFCINADKNRNKL